MWVGEEEGTGAVKCYYTGELEAGPEKVFPLQGEGVERGWTSIASHFSQKTKHRRNETEGLSTLKNEWPFIRVSWVGLRCIPPVDF